LGGFHSADCLMYSVDFHDIEQMQMNDDWDAAGAALAAAAQRLERGGADVLIMATNTMHLVADAITSAVDVPFIHIADATADAIKAAGVDRVALLGTRFTMEGDFMRGRLREQHCLDVRVPDEAGRATVHRVIYDELVQGEIKPDSRAAYVDIIEGMAQNGAGGVILGCTEIGLLIGQEHVSIPAFDTTRIHAEAAVAFALGEA
jgi:aspartate racemase